MKKVNEEGEAVYSKEQAEKQAFEDFSSIAEETQQSGDPALISSDQASVVGRALLAFQNTPIQLNRSIKKAAQDIYNKRRAPGLTLAQSNMSNMSKILYYGTVQTAMFSALQNALFALVPGFDDDDDDDLTEKEQKEKYGKVIETKQSRILHGMIDTTLKGGFGIPGAFLATAKSAYLEYDKQKQKKFLADHAYTILALANLAPSVGSKLRKVYSGTQTLSREKDVIAAREWDVTINGKFNLSPNYKAYGSITEGLTNIPLDRVYSELESLSETLDSRNTIYQRMALALGWRAYDVGAGNEDNKEVKKKVRAKKATEKKKKKEEKRKTQSTYGGKTYKKKLYKPSKEYK